MTRDYIESACVSHYHVIATIEIGKRSVEQFQYKASGKSIPYEELDLERPWETFDIQHELTRKGIEKFAADYRATLSRPA